MRMIRTIAVAAAVLLMATGAMAQRGHGPIGGTTQPGGMGNGMGEGMSGMSLLVAPDGTVITVSATLDATTSSYTSSVVAVNASGSVAWRWAAPNGMHRLELAGNLVLVSAGGIANGGPTTATDSELTALSLSDGSVAWKATLPGIAVAIESSATQIYALVMDPQATGSGSGMGGGMGGGHQGPPGSGTGGTMMNGARTLVALSQSGVILWKLELN